VATAIDLGQAEVGILGGDDDIRVTHQTDAAAEAVAVHGADHRHLTLVDRLEGQVAAAIGAEQRIESFRALHLLDVHAGVPAPTLGAQHERAHLGVVAEACDELGQIEPALHAQGVDRRVVHDDLGDAVGDAKRGAHVRK
jgi:hypothetical protein